MGPLLQALEDEWTRENMGVRDVTVYGQEVDFVLRTLKAEWIQGEIARVLGTLEDQGAMEPLLRALEERQVPSKVAYHAF